MDMSTMMSKIDLKKYECVAEFMKDIHLICSNALEYNPDKDPQVCKHKKIGINPVSETLEIKPDNDSRVCKQVVNSVS